MKQQLTFRLITPHGTYEKTVREDALIEHGFTIAMAKAKMIELVNALSDPSITTGHFTFDYTTVPGETNELLLTVQQYRLCDLQMIISNVSPLDR